MKFYQILFQFLLLISIIYCHDIHRTSEINSDISTKQDDIVKSVEEEEKILFLPKTSPQILRSASSRFQQNSQDNLLSTTESDNNLEQKSNENDLPRQVHIHDSETILNEWKTTKFDVENDTNTHIPRSFDTNENTSQPNINNNPINSKIEEAPTNQSNMNLYLRNMSEKYLINTSRHVCWQIPKQFESSIRLLENQMFYFITLLPDFIQNVLFGHIDDREILMNTMWFTSICTICVFFSLLFLSLGTQRLKQNKSDKYIRIRCQQLQQHNNQIELERETFERQNQKLTDEIVEIKNLPIRDFEEEIFSLREECNRFEEDCRIIRNERDLLQQEIECKQNSIQKFEFDIQRQIEIVANLNNEILQLKNDLEKERTTIGRLQSKDLSIERFEKSQELIQQLKSEISELKQEKFSQIDQLKEKLEYINQLELVNNQLTQRMKQLKSCFEQKDRTIKTIEEKLRVDNTKDLEDLFPILDESNSNSNELLLIIDDDIKKSNEHVQQLQNEIEEKTRRIKELDLLYKQEKDHCREMETKLKVVLELRERDAHLHIRQLGQTDAELRKARTDAERVRILQQQTDFKQQQLDDVQKLFESEQIKFKDELNKMQRETHEKWMEVKRLTRELESSKKECENLRKQITKYAANERSTQEGTAQVNSSNSPVSYQQGETFRPIDSQRNDSGATSPDDMLVPRPPVYGLPRFPFFPGPFRPPPPTNPLMMYPRFPMSTTSPSGVISPFSQFVTNGNDTNNSDVADTSNITPNSTNYDLQSNGIGASPPLPADEETQVKPKKNKKSSKKKKSLDCVNP